MLIIGVAIVAATKSLSLWRRSRTAVVGPLQPVVPGSPLDTIKQRFNVEEILPVVTVCSCLFTHEEMHTYPLAHTSIGSTYV